MVPVAPGIDGLEPEVLVLWSNPTGVDCWESAGWKLSRLSLPVATIRLCILVSRCI
jgi:hypothetical protein